MAEHQMRILCVEDHLLVREGIELIVNLHSDMKVVASASTGAQAVDLYMRHRPDVTLMDLQLPIMGGLEAIRAIRAEDNTARIIVLTMYSGDEDIHNALELGAITYILKHSLSSELIQVLREVHAGRRPLPEDVAARLLVRVDHPGLTPREVDVVKLLVEGLRNKEIAAALSISEMTVEAHIKHVFAKLHVSDRTAAVTAALRRGFIHL